MLILGIVGFGITLLANAGGALSAPLPQNLDGWQRYTDERFQLSFAYPADWYLNVIPADSAGGGIQISNYSFDDSSRNQKSAPTNYIKIEIMLVGGDPKSKTQSIAEWRHARADFASLSVIKEYPILINDIEAWEEVVAYSSDEEITTTYFPFHDNIYGDTILFISATPFPTTDFEAVYRTIVSTLSFDK